MNWSDYSKAIGGIVGGALGWLLMFLAAKTAMVECAIPTDYETCVVLGTFSYNVMWGFIVQLFGLAGVILSPKNTINGKPAIPSE